MYDFKQQYIFIALYCLYHKINETRQMENLSICVWIMVVTVLLNLTNEVVVKKYEKLFKTLLKYLKILYILRLLYLEESIS